MMLTTTATCATGVYDPDMWFPTRTRPDGKFGIDLTQDARARLVCVECPARVECLLFALGAERGDPVNLRFGVFGGLGPPERAMLAAGTQKFTALPGERCSTRSPWYLKEPALVLMAGWRDGQVSTAEASTRAGTSVARWLHAARQVRRHLLETGGALPPYSAQTALDRVAVPEPVPIQRGQRPPERGDEGAECVSLSA